MNKNESRNTFQGENDMDNEYERTLILKELRQYVQQCEAEADKSTSNRAEIIREDIAWHQQMLSKYEHK